MPEFFVLILVITGMGPFIPPSYDKVPTRTLCEELGREMLGSKFTMQPTYPDRVILGFYCARRVP